MVCLPVDDRLESALALEDIIRDVSDALPVDTIPVSKKARVNMKKKPTLRL